MKNAGYNSRATGMLTSGSLASFSVFASFISIGMLLLAATAWGQNWAGAEEQLAEKIVAVTGSRTIVR